MYIVKGWIKRHHKSEDSFFAVFIYLEGIIINNNNNTEEVV